MTGADVAVEAVRVPTDEQAGALARLLPLLSSARPPDRGELENLASAPGTDLFFARLDDGRIVGTLTLVTYRIPTGTRSLIEDVIVDEQARGRGIGAALVMAGLARAREHGARTVDLTSRPSRAAANRLYERCGFTRRETNVWRVSLED